MIFSEQEGGESLPLPAHDILVRHRNPGAKFDLVIPFVTECNTSDEQIRANIAANSALDREWIGALSPHSGRALICGSGPSLGDDLEAIRRMSAAGAQIFAMNGAAGFLGRNGIHVDYQFIIDARPDNVCLIADAGTHIFASQVDPELFARAPNARLVHVGAGDLDLPERDGDYVILIGHSSCGNVAPGLAYALGYRDLHCFGYDSSHRGVEGHAFTQIMNDGEPLMWLERGGKRYLTSFTMRQQANVFPGVARDLRELGCTVTMHGTGLLPDNFTMSEREKYNLLWRRPEYRQMAPGEYCVAAFMTVAKVAANASVIDFGCGTGRAGLALERAGLNPILIDFVPHCRDEAALHLPFYEADLTGREPPDVNADYGFCTDVMEHIPPDDTWAMLDTMFACAPRIFFQIDREPDVCGALIGQQLHINLRSHAEWFGILQRYGRVTLAQEDQRSSIFYVEAEAI